jgi:hypothetical protein
MCPILDESRFLRCPILHEQHTVFDGHASIQHTVDQEQPTALLLDNAVVYKAVGLLAAFDKLFPRTITVFAQISSLQIKRIFVVVNFRQPFLANVVMNPRTVAYCTSKSFGMCMCQADCVVAPCRQSPCDHLAGIELMLRRDPVENGRKEAVRGQGIILIRRAACDTWDVTNHCSPTAL